MWQLNNGGAMQSFGGRWGKSGGKWHSNGGGTGYAGGGNWQSSFSPTATWQQKGGGGKQNFGGKGKFGGGWQNGGSGHGYGGGGSSGGGGVHDGWKTGWNNGWNKRPREDGDWNDGGQSGFYSGGKRPRQDEKYSVTLEELPATACWDQNVAEVVTLQTQFLTPIGFLDAASHEKVMAKRTELEVTVEGEEEGIVAPPVLAFHELTGVLPEYVQLSLQEAGKAAPMPIQAQTLPFTLRGKDLIGIAKTGSGKTIAFLLPAIVHIEAQPPIQKTGPAAPIALVLAPVRELAVQIAEEANKLLWNSKAGNHPGGIGAVSIYGGGGRVRWQQVEELKKGWCQIVVATPGRMADLLTNGELTLNRVSFFVLDEADRMLEGGFGDQMDQVSKGIRPDRQTLFFSATWPTEVQQLAGKMCHAPPVRINIGQVDSGDGPSARSDITQEIVVFDDPDWKAVEAAKQERLYSHLRALLQVEDNKVLVFVNMKSMAWELAGKLGEEGFSADFMYGGRSQDSRAEIVNRFKTGDIKSLVTTDVMARGLDIQGITHVVVFDCYGGIDEYVHRIGRTARGLHGRGGHALTFFEYDPKYSTMPADLIAVLEAAGQVVPPDLQQIANEVASGIRKSKKKS